MATPPDGDTAMLVYRINLLEQLVKQLQDQLSQYVTTKDSEREIKSIKEAVDRIEKEIGNAKAQLTDLSRQLTSQEIDIQRRDAEQQKAQSQLQIRVLWGVVSTIITIASLIFVGYATKILH